MLYYINNVASGYSVNKKLDALTGEIFYVHFRFALDDHSAFWVITCFGTVMLNSSFPVFAKEIVS